MTFFFINSTSPKLMALLNLVIFTFIVQKVLICFAALLSNRFPFPHDPQHGPGTFTNNRGFRSSLDTSLLLGGEDDDLSATTYRNNRKLQQQKESSIVVLTKTAPSTESTFWYSVEEPKMSSHKIPCEPNLDRNGPLPPGSYMPSKQCLITVGIDTTPYANNSSFFDKMDVLRGMQRYIDQGLTTFQMANYDNMLDEGTIFGALWKQTPRSVLSSCHLMCKLRPSPTQGGFQKFQVRNSILTGCLSRIGAEHIDTILVPYQSKSPYHMDILDVLVDLQRDGFVKSIGGLNFPPNLIQTAEACGFHLESNQVSRSLLNRRPLVNYEKLRTISIIASSPLACGLLTDNFYDKAYSIRTTAFHKPLSKPQSQYLNTIRASFDNRQPLSEFFYQLMSTLHEISWKHNVSISSVALRWILQQMQLDVVTTRVGRVDRSQSYREVFTFELDEDDLLKIELPERLKEK